MVWHSKLTVNQTCALERVQKTCLRVRLGREYRGYESALKVSNLERLEVRREKKSLSIVWEKMSVKLEPQIPVSEKYYSPQP